MIEAVVSENLRWSSYVLERGANFTAFWNQRFAEGPRPTLLIAGIGFDPRMPSVLSELLNCGAGRTLDVNLIRFDEGPQSPSQRYAEAVRANVAAVRQLVEKSGGQLLERSVSMLDEGRRVGGRRIASLFGSANELEGYSDVIVDISALPRTLYFPLLKQLLKLHEIRSSGIAEAPSPRNLHVALHDSPHLDAHIREELTERSDYLPGFGSDIDLEQDRDIPRVWAPVLGEKQDAALRLVQQQLSGSGDSPEICPVLPFPAADPRRADRLLLEYRALLFDAWKVELRNVIYAAERNPFDVYRQLCRLHDRYRAALRPLRGAKVIASAHSSKLLSLGVLLAAYDRPSLAVAHVEASGYVLDQGHDSWDDGELCEIWLAGEPFIA
jgi:hypothetical protein